MSLADHLNEIFDADRAARKAEEALLQAKPKELIQLLGSATRAALELDDREEAVLRLRRLADLCAQASGPEMVDALLAIIDFDDAGVRIEAGESLLSIAYERFKDVARAIEKRLDDNHPGLGMQELPFILTEVHDPDPVPLISRFLQHPSGEIAAAAIEALVEYGDPAAGPAIEALAGDEREVTIEELDEGPTTLGELARSALEQLDEE